nr:MAG TPA: hypothetical protein [Caudoviricetes sp.]
MAGRPKKEIIEQTTTEKVTTENVEKEVAPIELNDNQKLKEQAEQIANLQAQLEVLMRAQANVSVEQTEPKRKKKMVKIISLVAGGLTLQGSRIIRIDKQFDSVSVTDAEARIIISNMPKSAREGIFYIADNDFVEENDLEDAYQTILDDRQLKTVLSKNAKDVVDIYQNAPDAQKKIIDSMIVDGRLMGLEIDANILMELGKISGIDYFGIEKVEEVEAQ